MVKFEAFDCCFHFDFLSNNLVSLGCLSEFPYDASVVFSRATHCKFQFEMRMQFLKVKHFSTLNRRNFREFPIAAHKTTDADGASTLCKCFHIMEIIESIRSNEMPVRLK